MIFITLGSQKFQFNRLLQMVDRLVESGGITERVFAQSGYSDYVPANFKCEAFMDRDEFAANVDMADIVITHGGTGAIIEAVKKGKKVIAVPRRAQYGEHVDDHQLQLVGQFEELGLICVCQNCDELDTALAEVRSTVYRQYVSNTAVILDSLDRFISEV